MSEARRYRAKVAALSRHRPADDPAIVEARRDLAAALLASHVARVVADSPPLTGEQRDRIVALLVSGDNQSSRQCE